MSTPQSTNPQDYYLDGLSKITSAIVKQSGNGDCIYRGEPESYDEEPYCGKVSSTLYRMYPRSIESGNILLLQQEILNDFRSYLTAYEQVDDFEILTELQHFGTETNLIDFTSDYHVALFFACNGFHDKDGRVILLKTTDDIRTKYSIRKPLSPQSRVLSQKSVFAQPPRGYIATEDMHIIRVPADLKQWTLIHLRKFQDLSTRSVFNDLHGFMRHRNLTWSDKARLPLYFADSTMEDLAQGKWSREERPQKLEPAIKDYTSALQYLPYDAMIYCKLGQCFAQLGNFNAAFETLTKAIWLSSDYEFAYFFRALCFDFLGHYENSIADNNKVIELDKKLAYASYFQRGVVLLKLKNWHAANSDLMTAKAKGMNIAIEFANFHNGIQEFQVRFDVTLPANIASMLQPAEPPQIAEESSHG